MTAIDSFGALVAFSFVSIVTPGPNNVLLWTSGAEFGLRRTVRHVLGTALGIGALAIAVAAGLGALVTAIPEIAFAMKVAGSIYLLYLAYRIAGAGALERATMSRPLGIVQAAAFQAINPKSWIFALTAITTFRPTDVSPVAGSLLVALTMMVVIVPTEALWAGAGGILSGALGSGGGPRSVRLVLAALLAATVVWVWI